MDKSREQFEAWVKKYHGVSVNEFPSANMVEMFWQAWKASRAAVEIELPEIQWDIDFDGSQHYDCEDIKNCLTETGLKVKQ